MGELKNKGKKFMYCFIVGIMVGALGGSSMMSALMSYKLDQSYEKVTILENELRDKDTKLEKLQESINTMHIVLEDIQVVLSFAKEEEIQEIHRTGKIKEEGQEEESEEIDGIDEMEIKEAIKEKYTVLLGKEVKNIDVDLVLEVVDKRIFKIGNKEFKLKVNKLILTEILKIWVEVEEIV